MRRLAGVLSLVPAALLWTQAAAAEPGGTRIALDAEYAIPIDESGISGGPGGALRFGHELDLLVLALTPELMASYYGFGGDYSPSFYAGSVGARLSFGKVVEPGVFAHVGVGHVAFDLPGGLDDADRTAFTYDAGLTLDFTLLPLLEIGAHAAYHGLAKGDAAENLDWVALGLHATLAL